MSTEPSATNDVHLTGRLAAVPVRSVLPSGDEVVRLRVVVQRPARRGARTTGRRVDTIECAVWRATLARRVERWEAGDVVSVDGALRRHFWRSGGGARSRYEVEVLRARRLR